MSLFRRKHSAALGLDINAEGIRLLHLGKHDQTWVIKDYAAMPLPATAIVAGKIQQFASIQQVLKQLVESMHLRGYAVALALPGNTVISQRIALAPQLPLKEYEIAISANLSRYFPGVQEALCFDFMPLDPAYQEVLLVAARQGLLASYLALVQGAGLKVKLVDVDYFALLRAVPLTVTDFTAQSVVGVLHQDAQATDFIIFSDKNILLQQRWYQNPVGPSLNDALQFYYALPAAKKIDYVVVSGTQCAAAMAYFNELARIKVYLANPLISLPCPDMSVRQRLHSDSTRLQICCGLALRSASL